MDFLISNGFVLYTVLMLILKIAIPIGIIVLIILGIKALIKYLKK